MLEKDAIAAATPTTRGPTTGDLRDESAAGVWELEAFLASIELDFDSSAPLAQALVHRSYASEQNSQEHNERLEILGDAVVGLLVMEGLFWRYPHADEGELSRRRASLVSRYQLGVLGQQLGLGVRMKLGKGEERTGGRTRSSNLGSCLEAVVGAVYLERGLEACRRFVQQFVLPHDRGVETPNDAKSRLQEIVQRIQQQPPRYETIDA
jgi:ribonuclease-3